MAARLWTWLRADFGHVVIAVAVVGIPLYFLGVILFDNSTEDGARDRAAARVAQGLPASDPPLTGPEQAYHDAMEVHGGGDYDLAIGRAWCSFFDTDRTQTAGFESATYRQLAAAGHDDYLLSWSWDAASTALCPTSYRAWDASMPHIDPGPMDQYDFEPPVEEYERDFGPRG